MCSLEGEKFSINSSSRESLDELGTPSTSSDHHQNIENPPRPELSPRSSFSDSEVQPCSSTSSSKRTTGKKHKHCRSINDKRIPPNVRLPQRKGGMHLWQFLYAMLLKPNEYSHLIEWTTNKVQFEFRLLKPEAIAAWWGHHKNKKSMSYDKLSRSLRYYYDKCIIRKMSGERYVYRFCLDPELMYTALGNSEHRPQLKPIPKSIEFMHLEGHSFESAATKTLTHFPPLQFGREELDSPFLMRQQLTPSSTPPHEMVPFSDEHLQLMMDSPPTSKQYMQVENYSTTCSNGTNVYYHTPIHQEFASSSVAAYPTSIPSLPHPPTIPVTYGYSHFCSQSAEEEYIKYYSNPSQAMVPVYLGSNEMYTSVATCCEFSLMSEIDPTVQQFFPPVNYSESFGHDNSGAAAMWSSLIEDYNW